MEDCRKFTGEFVFDSYVGAELVFVSKMDVYHVREVYVGLGLLIPSIFQCTVGTDIFVFLFV